MMGVLLLTTIFLPLAAAVLPLGHSAMRGSALVAASLSLAGAAALVCLYPGGTEPFAPVDTPWLAAAGVPVDVRFSIALDGLSLWLFALTALLVLCCVLISWEVVRAQQSLYYRLLLLLETGMLGVFAARDIILFYLFFEFTLVPLFFLIGIWGSDQRRHAAIKFFLFTLAGSVFALVGLLVIVLWCSLAPPALPKMTFSIAELTRHLAEHPMPWRLQMAVFLALFAGFAIKVPLVPLHTWLPLAHVEAPAAGSVLLAGVLLKVGAYGFVRFSLPMLPEATAACAPWLLWLSVVGIVYGALVALAQADMKRLIAYSSVSHLGFCMLGVFAGSRIGLEGGVLQMVNHGLSTGGLFAVVGMLYERYHTRRIADFGGIAREMPVAAFFMVFLALASIGLPGLNGFVGEFLVLLAMFQRAFGGSTMPGSVLPDGWSLHYRVIAVLAASGVVLGACYMLSLVRRVFFGPQKPRKGPAVRDLSRWEIAALAPLLAVILWIGVGPGFFLDRMAPTLAELRGETASELQREIPSTQSPIPNPQSLIPNP
jgi:NADH-quinone oxidoreductase subunit M